MSEKVSVLIPSYNHAPFLRACIASALGQTHKDLEVLVVDDCSTDQSLSIAQSIRDPRLRVVKNERNMGTYATQNAALSLATGDWIAILNSDDLWEAEKLELQLQAVQNHGGTWCYALGEMIDENGNVLAGDPQADWPRDEVQDLLPYLVNVNRILASSLMFKRGAVEFQSRLRYCGDWVASLWLAEHCRAIFVPERLTFWRQHSTNSFRRSPALTLEEIQVRRAILDRRDEWLEKAGEPAKVGEGLQQCAMALSALYVLTGQMRLARAAAKMATKLGPSNVQAQKRRLIASMPKKIAQRRLWPNEEEVSVETPSE